MVRKTYSAKTKLIEARQGRKLSRRVVAEMLEISPSHYTKIETGERGISLELANDIARFFNLKIEDLID